MSAQPERPRAVCPPAPPESWLSPAEVHRLTGLPQWKIRQLADAKPPRLVQRRDHHRRREYRRTEVLALARDLRQGRRELGMED